MVKLGVVLVVLGFVLSLGATPTWAKDKKEKGKKEQAAPAKKGKGKAVAGEAMTLVGTLSKEVNTKDDKEVTVYTLTMEDGTTTVLPAGKKAMADVDVDSLIDQKVTIVGEGSKGNKGIHLTKVSSATKVAEQ